MIEDKILCPDCELEYISRQYYERNKKCRCCAHRETLAKKNNVEYIPVKDLPEKERLLYIERKAQNKKYYADRAKTKVKTSKVKKQTRHRVGKIFTPDVIKYLISISDENKPISEIYQQLVAKYPDNGITNGNLRNVVTRKGVPYKKVKKDFIHKKEENQVIEKEEVDKINNINLVQYTADALDDSMSDDDNDGLFEDIDLDENTINTVVDSKYEFNKQNNKISDYTKQLNSVVFSDDVNTDVIYNTAKNDVSTVLSNTFEQMKCDSGFNYAIDDYIKVVELIKNIIMNINELKQIRYKQYNLMNGYQLDVLHEAENIDDTKDMAYVGDKLHIIRKYRRYFKTDYRNLQIINNLFRGIALDVLENSLDSLKKNNNLNTKPIFKPIVDLSLISRYDWAKPIDANTHKSQVRRSVVNTIRARKTIAKKDNNVLVYRVTCNLHGGSYGESHLWIKEYIHCISAKQALAHSINTLGQLHSKNSNITWTDLKVDVINENNEIVDTILADNSNIEDKSKNVVNNMTTFQKVIMNLGSNFILDAKMNNDYSSKDDLVQYIGQQKLRVRHVIPEKDLNSVEDMLVYKLSFTVSGADFGVFEPCRLILVGNSEDQIKDYGNLEIKKIKDSYKGILINNVEYTEIGL